MILRFANCELDCNRQRLIRDGQTVAVEPQVFDLIHLLAENSNRLVTRDEIVERVWAGRIVSDGAISARIASARKAVGDNGTDQKIIRTVQRRGLQMVVQVIIEDTTKQASNPGEPVDCSYDSQPRRSLLVGRYSDDHQRGWDAFQHYLVETCAYGSRHSEDIPSSSRTRGQ